MNTGKRYVIILSTLVITALYLAAQQPIVSSTANPLVASYAASCTLGSSMQVRFKRPADTRYLHTPPQACSGATLTFLIAGMRATTLYDIQHMITSATGVVTSGPLLTFVTGTPTETFIAGKILTGPSAQTCMPMGILLQDFVPGKGVPAPPAIPTATDLSGNVVWYYDTFDGQLTLLARALPGGNMLVMTGPHTSIVREIDLAWNKIRETNITNVNAQLAAKGFQNILNFNHEAIRLPNGQTAVLASEERLFTNVQGPGTVDVLGDMLIVLDKNFNVVWAWDSFAHMDVSRQAVLGEICSAGVAANYCPPITLATQANDWLHCNTINYNSQDGSLILSVRNQDWVIKIDYANGSGTGNVLWRLGNQGDFKMINTFNISSPWFSHQHDVEFEPSGGSGVLSLFDNGNTRRSTDPSAQSRGQELVIDESLKTADITLSVNLAYSSAVGSAQLLPNGNYHFLSGDISGAQVRYSQNYEVTATGSATGVYNYELQAAATTYRSFRMPDMYTPH